MGFAQKSPLPLLRIRMGLESAGPLQNTDGTDGTESRCKTDVEIISFHKSHAIGDAILPGGSFDESQSFCDRFQGNDRTLLGEGTCDLAPA